jgi:hypothetical protein
VPLLYLGFGHVCLLAAMALLAGRAASLGGFYYHPRLIAVVHLVTLGFITSAILGALYLVGPLALRLPLPERRADLLAVGSWIVGVSGIVSHFWIERYEGMAWSGAMALLTPLWVGARVLVGLRRAPAPLEARLPIALAILNLFAAGALGVMLGVNKHHPFLPFAQLAGVHAHLHLAAVGFATLMVVGVGYRMLPMVIPAAPPRGRLALTSGLVIEAGTLGLAAALLFAPRLLVPCAVLVVAGLGLFFSRVAFMLANRRPPPTERPRPDWPLLHAMQALAYLALTALLGLTLAAVPASDAALRLAMAYGACGLLGFLSQLVVGIEARLVPLAAWLHGFAAGGYGALPPSVHTAMPPAAAMAAWVAWTLGVPCVAGGLAFDRAAATATGAAALALAVAITAASAARAVRRLRRAAPAAPEAV